jgi:hypothetical protein
LTGSDTPLLLARPLSRGSLKTSNAALNLSHLEEGAVLGEIHQIHWRESPKERRREVPGKESKA